MTYEEALRKATALLRLATSSNPNESALAAAKAQDIMDRFNISKEVLNQEQGSKEPDEPVTAFGNEPVLTACQKDSIWSGLLTHYVARHYACRYYRVSTNDYGSRAFYLIGRASDVQTARYMIGLLAEEVRRLAKAQAAGYSDDYRKNFKAGVVDTIATKLREQRKTTEDAVRAEAGKGMALVKVNNALLKLEQKQLAVDKWLDDNTGKGKRFAKGRASSNQSYNPSARDHGRKAGQSINVSSRAKGGLTSGAKQLSAA
jgi:hypothetical protein